MARNLADLQREIAALQKEADALLAAERNGVIDRIKQAIDHYSLKPSELFGKRDMAAAGGESAGTRPASSASKTGTKSPIKFRDDQGNTWTGVGKRPRWYLAAIESGKTPDDLRVG